MGHASETYHDEGPGLLYAGHEPARGCPDDGRARLRGDIPVVDDRQSMKPVGIVTDRDICCRTVAEGKNPLEMPAGDCMSNPCLIVTPEMSVEDCCQMMKENKIRRVPVVDERGACCGIVAQADIARHASEQETAEVVKEVSRAAGSSSRAS
jgi:CBS domain-containing protein